MPKLNEDFKYESSLEQAEVANVSSCYRDHASPVQCKRGNSWVNDNGLRCCGSKGKTNNLKIQIRTNEYQMEAKNVVSLGQKYFKEYVLAYTDKAASGRL